MSDKNNKNLHSRYLSNILLTIVFAFSCGSLLAQEDQEEAVADEASIETEIVDSNATTEPAFIPQEIIITGSRIARDNFSSASPIQIISSQTSALEGLVTISEVLQSSTSAANSGQVNNTFTGFVVDGGGGIDTISLRGLGAQRTLVLLNGRRFPPAGVSGTVGPVDLNTLPNTIFSRAEILKDGASSVYGSDAVAGVVNIITRDNVDGFTVNGSVDLVGQGGAEEYLLASTYGKSFDRGSFSVSAEYYTQRPLTYGERDFLSCPQEYLYDGEGNRVDAIDTRTNNFKCFRTIEGYVQTYFPINAPFGTGGGFYGSRIPDPVGSNYEGIPGYRFIPFFERSYDDPRDNRETLISPRDRLSIFSQGDYRPASFDTTQLYYEFLYSHRESEQIQNRLLFPFYHHDSAVNPYSGNIESFDFGPLFDLPEGEFLAPLDGFLVQPLVLVPFDQKQKVDMGRILGGATGEFSGGFLDRWSWDIYISHSESTGEYSRLVSPEDRINAGTGTIQETLELNPDGICGASAPAGCLPLDLFRTPVLFDGRFNAAELAYYFVDETGSTDYSQTIIEGSMTGDLFTLPAGEVAGALGFMYRRDEIDDIPGRFSVDANVWGLLSAVATQGNDHVSEIYAEADLPILRNRSLFEDLSLNVSGRYSSYNSVGTATTFKLGINWQVNESVRIRATRGTSFRAPQLYELFLGDQTSFLSQTQVDPCINYGVSGPDRSPIDPTTRANCAADGLPPNYGGAGSSTEVLTGGNLDLDPEDSTASTLGFVITPAGTDLSLSVTGFEIEVENQVGSFSSGVVRACYADQGFRSERGFCDLFTRVLDPNAVNFGQITNIDASYRNIPAARLRGIDFAGRYNSQLDLGRLLIEGEATYITDSRSELFPGAPIMQYAGLIGEPKLVANMRTFFEQGDWTYFWTLNFTGIGNNFGFEGEDGRFSTFYAPDAYTRTEVSPYITHDMSIRKEWDDFAMIIGVRNLLNDIPDFISDGDDAGSARRLGNLPASSQYIDGYIGRSFVVNLSRRF
ncbi:MAG: TonB-dependent receptor [Gammaproteobacteria bacterium]|nr:TonB-dependent receptor [Gammaproteobacteria bacterium]